MAHNHIGGTDLSSAGAGYGESLDRPTADLHTSGARTEDEEKEDAQ